jgi:hypothetical protein
VAYHTVEDGPWPYGVTVTVWATDSLVGGLPSGAPIDSAVAHIDGTVTFGDLTEGESYTAFGHGGSQEFRAINQESVLGNLQVVEEAPLNVDYPEYADLADGDDWQAAMTAAANAVPATGGAIYMPPRSTAREVDYVKLKSKTRLWADGPGATLKLKDNAAAVSAGGYTTHRAILTGDDGLTGLTIEGVEFDCNVANNYAIEQTHAMEFFGLRDSTFRNCVGRDIRGELLCVTKASGSSNRPGGLTISQMRGYNTGAQNGGPGNDRQMIALTDCEGGTISDIYGEQVKGYLLCLETDNEADVIENLTIDGLTVYDGKGVLAMLGIGDDTIRGCLASNLRAKDGPTYGLTYIATMYKAKDCQLAGLSADATLFANAVTVDACNDTILSRVQSFGASFDGTRSSITVNNSNRTLVTASSLRKSGGTPRYGVEETGTCTETIVAGNRYVSGDLGDVLLTGTGSRAFANGNMAVQTYAASNVTTDRTFNANSTTTDELADVLGTLIADLRAQGIVA